MSIRMFGLERKFGFCHLRQYCHGTVSAIEVSSCILVRKVIVKVIDALRNLNYVGMVVLQLLCDRFDYKQSEAVLVSYKLFLFVRKGIELVHYRYPFPQVPKL